jgi:hypothetical protein
MHAAHVATFEVSMYQYKGRMYSALIAPNAPDLSEEGNNEKPLQKEKGQGKKKKFSKTRSRYPWSTLHTNLPA